MSVDASKIGIAAASLMETVEEQHPDGELRDVLVIAEISFERDGDEWTAYRWAGSSQRSSVDAGICAHALEGITRSATAEDD